MEPRLLRRGNIIQRPAGNRSRFPASMEPRLLRRGNIEYDALLRLVAQLQWSHAFSDVETC